MKKVIVINGPARVGKDTFCEMCIKYAAEHYNIPGFNISSVDRVKEAAMTLGWDGVKDEIGRKFLADLKDLSTKAYDGPMNYILNVLQTNQRGIFFFHIREPEEIAKFVEKTGATAVCVKRDVVEQFMNRADANAYNYKYDVTIMNGGKLKHLEKAAAQFVDMLFG
ncbi:MAG TPA: hypothetical protein DEG42_00165 [Acholeplasmataceae bacterium]|nr:hypothetical protein [Acholeplasmataceae bacterium]